MISRKFLTISVPAALVAALVVACAIEIWVRATWDPRKGRPGFFLTDATRGQRLAAGYDGWFAGVPVHINSLELRDPREYPLAKGPNTFRILILGDSVTFGHGSVYEHTYPYLAEQKLKAWRSDVDWQVWNAAVPGYNTSQELAHLLEVGDRFAPDLVVVAFFGNDLIDNRPAQAAGRLRTLSARAISMARRHLYSLEFYKRVYLTFAWRFAGSDEYRKRIAHLGTEEDLLAATSDASTLAQQSLTPFTRISDEQVAATKCIGGMRPSPEMIPALQREPGFAEWLNAVRGFQQLNGEGRYRVAFFVNDVPPVCPDGDYFYDGSHAMHEFLLGVLGHGTPAVSCYEAFLHTRPSEMPNATAHALGNANVVKAEVLFDFLSQRLLPGLLPGAAASTARPLR